jgi:hypothetical protein
MDPCTTTQAVRNQLNALGVDIASMQAKVDGLAKQANLSMDFFDIPLVDTLLTDIGNAVGSTLTGVVGQITQELSQYVQQASAIIGATVALLTMLASMGTQVQLLLVSQLRREVAVRIVLFELLRDHYINIQRVLRLLQVPASSTWKKLIVVLPYMKRAEAQLNRLVLAEAQGGLPARLSYSSLKGAYGNIELAARILTADGSQGGKELGNALSLALYGKKVPKKRWETIGQKMAKDLIVNSIAKSLSYIEELTWNYMRITSLLPIPFALSDTIFKPVNYVDQYLKANNMTVAGVEPFNATKEDLAVEALKKSKLKVTDNLADMSITIAAADLVKGIIPTNIVIDSLIGTLVNYPNFNVDLKFSTQNLIAYLMPLKNTVQDVRISMEESIRDRDSDIVLSGKEAIWLTTLNSIIALKNGILPPLEGQAALNDSAYVLANLTTWLVENEGAFIIASNMPKFILQTVEVLRAPFNKRSLEESMVLTTFVVKQLNKAIQIDRRLLNRMWGISEPLSMFSELLNMAKQLPPPVSSIANALMNGQAQQVLGFISAITLGTVDSIASLFSPACPEIKNIQDAELLNGDDIEDKVKQFDDDVKVATKKATGPAAPTTPRGVYIDLISGKEVDPVVGQAFIDEVKGGMGIN